LENELVERNEQLKSVQHELFLSHERLKAVEDELLQHDDQLVQLTAELKSSQEECASKSDEVFTAIAGSEVLNYFYCRFMSSSGKSNASTSDFLHFSIGLRIGLVRLSVHLSVCSTWDSN